MIYSFIIGLRRVDFKVDCNGFVFLKWGRRILMQVLLNLDRFLFGIIFFLTFSADAEHTFSQSQDIFFIESILIFDNKINELVS